MYVDGLEVSPDDARPALEGWTGGTGRLHVSHDPAWREVGHLLA